MTSLKCTGAGCGEYKQHNLHNMDSLTAYAVSSIASQVVVSMLF